MPHLIDAQLKGFGKAQPRGHVGIWVGGRRNELVLVHIRTWPPASPASHRSAALLKPLPVIVVSVAIVACTEELIHVCICILKVLSLPAISVHRGVRVCVAAEHLRWPLACVRASEAALFGL